jgi:mono/diheme cytochrome c family protein
MRRAVLIIIPALLFLALLAACESHSRAKQLIEEYKCRECHTLHGKGGAVGPNLTNVGSRRDREYIHLQIKNPKSHNPNTAMPSFGDRLSAQDLDALTDYLAGLK